MNRVLSRMCPPLQGRQLANDIDMQFLSHPKRFECDIKPRLPKYAELIEAAAAVDH